LIPENKIQTRGIFIKKIGRAKKSHSKSKSQKIMTLNIESIEKKRGEKEQKKLDFQ